MHLSPVWTRVKGNIRMTCYLATLAAIKRFRPVSPELIIPIGVLAATGTAANSARGP